VRTSNFYIVDTATDPRRPTVFKTIDGEEIKRKTNLSAPHTVHCLGSDLIVSMLGDADGNAPGGFLHLNKDFEIMGRWENDLTGMEFNYDFWYQPRHNMMVSSEWAAPNTFLPGFDLEDVGKGKYGRRLHFWDFGNKSIARTIDLGEEGLIPLETRFLHDPNSTHGFVGAALSSNIFHWYQDAAGEVQVEKVIDVEAIDVESFPVPLPGLITDILVSMDDRYLYFSNWLHGDLRQYDISDPSHPVLTGQVWIGGLLGKAPEVNGHAIAGAPTMIQLSLGRQAPVCHHIPVLDLGQPVLPGDERGGRCHGGGRLRCGERGMTLNKDFFVDFGEEPNGPSRAHETRYPGGDCSSDIWV